MVEAESYYGKGSGIGFYPQPGVRVEDRGSRQIPVEPNASVRVVQNEDGKGRFGFSQFSTSNRYNIAPEMPKLKNRQSNYPKSATFNTLEYKEGDQTATLNNYYAEEGCPPVGKQPLIQSHRKDGGQEQQQQQFQQQQQQQTVMGIPPGNIFEGNRNLFHEVNVESVEAYLKFTGRDVFNPYMSNSIRTKNVVVEWNQSLMGLKDESAASICGIPTDALKKEIDGVKVGSLSTMIIYKMTLLRYVNCHSVPLGVILDHTEGNTLDKEGRRFAFIMWPNDSNNDQKIIYTPHYNIESFATVLFAGETMESIRKTVRGDSSSGGVCLVDDDSPLLFAYWHHRQCREQEHMDLRNLDKLEDRSDGTKRYQVESGFINEMLEWMERYVISQIPYSNLRKFNAEIVRCDVPSVDGSGAQKSGFTNPEGDLSQYESSLKKSLITDKKTCRAEIEIQYITTRY